MAKEREGMAAVGPSINQRAFMHIDDVFNSTRVHQLMCLVCGQSKTDIGIVRKAVSNKPKKRLKSSLCVNTFAAKEARDSEAHNIKPIYNLINQFTFYSFVCKRRGFSKSTKPVQNTHQMARTKNPNGIPNRCQIEPAPRRRLRSISGHPKSRCSKFCVSFWDPFWDPFFVTIEKNTMRKDIPNSI